MKYIIMYMVGLLFLGCSHKTTPVIVAFKKDNFVINDQGFLKEDSFSKKIEVYNVGQLVFVLTIKNRYICINKKCYDKGLFIHQINQNYPKNLLSLIIDKKPLPNLKIEKTDNGFFQKTTHFLYVVTDKKVFFRDKSKNFLFLLKKNR